MRIKSNFDKRQIELLNRININVEKDFDVKELEEIEDKVYNEMMNNLDEKQNFTTKLSVEYEHILDIVVEIENSIK